MRIIDLTHTFENDMPAYPGEESPTLQKIHTHENEGVQVIKFTSLTHSGTHLDMPTHFFKNSKTTDTVGLEIFFGNGVVIDCSNYHRKEEIPPSHLKNHEIEISKADFVLIYTGWDRYWGSPEYFDHFPVISTEAVKYLTSFKLKGIGLDVASLDAIDSLEYPNHNIILGIDMIIIENLTNLKDLAGRTFKFSAFPLKIKDGDGSPVRAVGIIN